MDMSRREKTFNRLIDRRRKKVVLVLLLDKLDGQENCSPVDTDFLQTMPIYDEQVNGSDELVGALDLQVDLKGNESIECSSFVRNH